MEDPDKNVPRTIAIICVLSDVLNQSNANASCNIADYLQASLSAMILNQNRKFSDVKLLTCNPIKDAINRFFADKVPFQYKNTKFEYSKDLLFQNPIISESKSFGEIDQFNELFNKTISEYEDEDRTSLFLFMIDHGIEESIGNLTYSQLLSTLSQKNFKYNFMFFDSCESGAYIEYIEACSFVNRYGIPPEKVNQIATLVHEANRIGCPTGAYDLAETLRYINIDAFIENASSSPEVFEVVSKFSTLNKNSIQMVKYLINYDDNHKKADISDLSQACMKLDYENGRMIQLELLEKLHLIGIRNILDFKLYSNFLEDFNLDDKLHSTSGLYYLHQIYLQLIESNESHSDISSYLNSLQRTANQVPFMTLTKEEAITISRKIGSSASLIKEFVIPKTLNLSLISSCGKLTSSYFYDEVNVDGKNIRLSSYGIEFVALLACQPISNFDAFAKDAYGEIFFSTKNSANRRVQVPTYISIGSIEAKNVNLERILLKTPAFDTIYQKDDTLINNFIRSCIHSGIIPNEDQLDVSIGKQEEETIANNQIPSGSNSSEFEESDFSHEAINNISNDVTISVSSFNDKEPLRYDILGKSTIEMFFDCWNYQLINHGYKEYYPKVNETFINKDQPAYEKYKAYEDKIDFTFKHYIYYRYIRDSLVIFLYTNEKPENPEEIYDLFMKTWEVFSPINKFYVEQNSDCLDFR